MQQLYKSLINNAGPGRGGIGTVMAPFTGPQASQMAPNTAGTPMPFSMAQPPNQRSGNVRGGQPFAAANAPGQPPSPQAAQAPSRRGGQPFAAANAPMAPQPPVETGRPTQRRPKQQEPGMMDKGGLLDFGMGGAMGLISAGAAMLTASSAQPEGQGIGSIIGAGLQGGLQGYQQGHQMQLQQQQMDLQMQQQQALEAHRSAQLPQGAANLALEREKFTNTQLNSEQNRAYQQSQINTLQRQAESNQKMVDKYPGYIDAAIETGVISADEKKLFSGMSAKDGYAQIQERLKTAGSRKKTELEIKQLENQMQSNKQFPKSVETLRETKMFDEADLNRALALGPEQGRAYLKTIKPSTVGKMPKSMSKANARGAIAEMLGMGQTLDPNNPAHRMLYESAYPKTITQVIENEDGSKSYVPVPSYDHGPPELAALFMTAERKKPKEGENYGSPTEGVVPTEAGTAAGVQVAPPTQKFSEDEEKNASYAESMSAALRDLDDFMQDYTPSPHVIRVLSGDLSISSMIGRKNFTEEDRLFEAKMRRFVDPISRSRSGATVKDEEMGSFMKQFFPTPTYFGGDDTWHGYTGKDEDYGVTEREHEYFWNAREEVLQEVIGRAGRAWTPELQERFSSNRTNPYGLEGKAARKKQNPFHQIKTKKYGN